jgi:hypothetical protein
MLYYCNNTDAMKDVKGWWYRRDWVGTTLRFEIAALDPTLTRRSALFLAGQHQAAAISEAVARPEQDAKFLTRRREVADP